jgi:predicted transposase/invertase (TIGR01784 family)
MTLISNPHDKLFKQIWSNRETARDFFAHYLPAEIRELLDLDTLEIRKDSFVDRNLKEYFSDLLYSVSFGDQSGYIYLLFEHKSHPEKITGLQLLSYICSIWKLHIRQEGLPLPVIVPLVLYHGRKNWSGSTDLQHLMSSPHKQLLAYVPDFSFILFDLSRFSDDQIKGEILSRTGMLLFKHVFTPGYEKKLPEIISLLKALLEKQTGLQYIETIIRYILNTAENMPVGDLKNMVEKNLSAEQGEMIMTLAEKIKQEGIRQGLEKGIQQGIQQGIRQGLIEAIEMGLQLRFGAEGYRIMPDIYPIEDINILRAVKEAVKNVKTLSEIKIVINR